MSTGSLLLVTLAVAFTGVVHGTSRGAAQVATSGLCNTCLVAVRVLEDALCDADALDFIVETTTNQLCPATPDPDECVELAQALLPVAIEWLRASATPASLCAAAGVCGEALLGDPVWDKAPARLVDDLSCPLCRHVVAAVARDAAANDAVRVGAGIGSPAAAASATVLRASAAAACGQLPGELSSACVSEFDKRGSLLRLAIGTPSATLSSSDVASSCERMGMCVEGLGRFRPPPLSPQLAAQLGALGAALAGTRTRLRAAPASPMVGNGVDPRVGAGAVRDNRCDICKLAVLEVATLVANPELQQIVLSYGEAACDAALPPAAAADCRDLVNTYGSAIFDRMQAILDPDVLCERMRLCAPPGSGSGSGPGAFAAAAVVRRVLFGVAR